MIKTERNLGGTAPRYLAILVAAVLGLSLFPAAALAGHNPDNDDPCADAPVANEYVDRNEARDPHEPSIDCVIYRSIAVGSTENGQQVYNPLEPVTRGQMASFVAQPLDAAGYGDQLSDGETDRFSDVAGNTHRLNINRLADAGIVSGVGGNRYAPNQLVSRQQMATYIVEAARFAVGDDHPVTRDAADQFVDVSNNNVHKDNIEAGADASPVLFRGETATTFAPGKNVLRDQMATFLVNLLRYAFNPGTAPNPDPVSVEIENEGPVTPGEPILIEILGNGDEVVSASVDDQGDTDADTAAAQTDNCLVSEGAITDTEPETEGIQGSLDTREDFTGDSCTLILTVTTENEDGEQTTTTHEVTVMFTQPETPTGATARPELTEAEIVDVDTSGTDAGTTIRYTFDEPVEDSASNLFFAYGEDTNTRFEGDDADLVEDNDDDTERSTQVDVFFMAEGDLDSQGEADDLRVATVEFGAVQDEDNLENPIGDAPLNDAAGDDETLPPGETSAPDVIGAEVGSDISGSDLFEVVVTFDEEVEVVNDANAVPTPDPGPTAEDDPQAFAMPGFYLVLEDGGLIDCQASDANPEDDEIDIECDESLDGVDEDDIARLIVDHNTVEDSSGNANPLQAVEINSDGDSLLPDLDSVEFFMRGSSDDQVVYTFDEPVGCTAGVDLDDCSNTAGLFGIYYDDTSTDQANDAEVDDDNTRVVIATFDDGDLDDAVAGYVEEGAVQERAGNQDDNRADELGVDNESTTEGSGFTSGPDLESVTYEAERNVSTGTLTGVTATYVFDEDVEVLGGGFFFYLLNANGERWEATDCEAVDLTDDPAVECTDYIDEDGDDADPDDLLDAVLGTVEYDEVQDDDGMPNPEGAEPATETAES